MFDKPWRNHPAIIIEKSFSIVWVFVLILFGDITQIVRAEYWRNAIAMLKQGSFTVFLSGAGGFIIVAVCLFIFFRQWSRTFFRFENGQLIVEKKTIFKKTSRLPVENIATVNLESNVFEQLLNISKVKIDISSSTTADATDFTFLMKTPLAAKFKAYITEIKGVEGAFSPDAERQSEARCLVHFGIKELIRNALLSVSPLSAFIIAFTFFISFGEHVQPYLILEFLPYILLGAVGTYMLLILTSAVNHYGFTLGIDGDNILLNRGLLKKRSYTFSREKIKAVIIKQSLTARFFGLYTVDVAVIGLGNESKETPSLTLYMKKNELDAVLKVCAQDFVCSAKTIPSAKKGLNALMLKAAICSAFTWFFMLIPMNWSIVVPLALSVIFFSAAYMSYRTKAIAYDEKIFRITSGIFSRKSVLLRYSDIRKAEILTNVYLKKYDVGKMRVSILSSSKFNNFKTGYFNLKHFSDSVDKVVG